MEFRAGRRGGWETRRREGPRVSFVDFARPTRVLASQGGPGCNESLDTASIGFGVVKGTFLASDVRKVPFIARPLRGQRRQHAIVDFPLNNRAAQLSWAARVRVSVAHR